MSLVFKHALNYILMMGCHTLPFILFVSNYPNKEKLISHFSKSELYLPHHHLFICSLLLKIVLCNFIQVFQEKQNDTDVEIQNSCIKYGTLGFQALSKKTAKMIEEVKSKDETLLSSSPFMQRTRHWKYQSICALFKNAFVLLFRWFNIHTYV